MVAWHDEFVPGMKLRFAIVPWLKEGLAFSVPGPVRVGTQLSIVAMFAQALPTQTSVVVSQLQKKVILQQATAPAQPLEPAAEEPPAITPQPPVQRPQPVLEPPAITSPPPVQRPQPVLDPPAITSPPPVQRPQPVLESPAITLPPVQQSPQPVLESPTTSVPAQLLTPATNQDAELQRAYDDRVSRTESVHSAQEMIDELHVGCMEPAEGHCGASGSGTPAQEVETSAQVAPQSVFDFPDATPASTRKRRVSALTRMHAGLPRLDETPDEAADGGWSIGDRVIAVGFAPSGVKAWFKASVIGFRQRFPPIVVRYTSTLEGCTLPLALPRPVTAYLLSRDIKADHSLEVAEDDEDDSESDDGDDEDEDDYELGGADGLDANSSTSDKSNRGASESNDETEDEEVDVQEVDEMEGEQHSCDSGASELSAHASKRQKTVYRLTEMPLSMAAELEAFEKYRTIKVNRLRSSSACVPITVANDTARCRRFLGWLHSEGLLPDGADVFTAVFGSCHVARWTELWMDSLRSRGTRASTRAGYVSSIFLLTSYVFDTGRPSTAALHLPVRPTVMLQNMRSQCESEARQVLSPSPTSLIIMAGAVPITRLPNMLGEALHLRGECIEVAGLAVCPQDEGTSSIGLHALSRLASCKKAASVGRRADNLPALLSVSGPRWHLPPTAAWSDAEAKRRWLRPRSDVTGPAQNGGGVCYCRIVAEV